MTYGKASESHCHLLMIGTTAKNVAKILVKMKLVASEENVTPQHFSSESPFGVHLPM